ncbi:hypothetical protein STEG23_037491 [Scotinomys teguina]
MEYYAAENNNDIMKFASKWMELENIILSKPEPENNLDTPQLEWIKKMWYIYTMEYFSAEKNNDIMKFAGKWVELQNVILSEVTQTHKDKHESSNQDLQNRLLNLESANLMQELQSINNKCTAKIGFVDNKYEYLMDRTLTLQSEVVTIQTLCKEERLSLIDKIRSLESCVSEEHNRWYDSMKNLESQAREEVHTLEQTLCARLQALEETLCKHDQEPNQNLQLVLN